MSNRLVSEIEVDGGIDELDVDLVVFRVMSVRADSNCVVHLLLPLIEV